MNPFSMVVAVVFIVFASVVAIIWLAKQPRKQLGPSKEHLELQTRVTKLEERIKILERITTDKATDLKREIEDL